MLHLTPDILRATYDFLRETPPFKRWRLPEGDAVSFRVIRQRDREGHAGFENGQHEIAVSTFFVGSIDALIRTIAHEMVHVRCHMTGVKSHHGRDFQKAALQVCRIHGFDPKMFQVGPVGNYKGC